MHLLGKMSPELRLPLCMPAETTQSAVRKAMLQLGFIGSNALAQGVIRVLSSVN
jgi:hypothetical protein